MGGSSGPNQFGVYGDKNIPNSENTPGSRDNALPLYDTCTHSFLLFGGYGYDGITLGKYFTINRFVLSILISVIQDH
mgnify:FL=1